MFKLEEVKMVRSCSSIRLTSLPFCFNILLLEERLIFLPALVLTHMCHFFCFFISPFWSPEENGKEYVKRRDMQGRRRVGWWRIFPSLKTPLLKPPELQSLRWRHLINFRDPHVPQAAGLEMSSPFLRSAANSSTAQTKTAQGGTMLDLYATNYFKYGFLSGKLCLNCLVVVVGSIRSGSREAFRRTIEFPESCWMWVDKDGYIVSFLLSHPTLIPFQGETIHCCI